jgi:putative restriction endonuclease
LQGLAALLPGLGIEAAHIMWHQAGGPATIQNGLALCILHHKLFDRGVFTFSEDRMVQVSELAHGGKHFAD